MNSEGIILQIYDNKHEATHNANFLQKEGITCTVEFIDPSNYPAGKLPRKGKYILKVSSEDEFMAKFILALMIPGFNQRYRPLLDNNIVSQVP